MKKLLLALIASGIGYSFAYDTIDLSKPIYKCSNMPITTTTTESQIQSKCKNVSMKTSENIADGHNQNHVSGGGADQIQNDGDSVQDVTINKLFFTTDNGTAMKCYFKNYTLLKCKAKI